MDLFDSTLELLNATGASVCAIGPGHAADWHRARVLDMLERTQRALRTWQTMEQAHAARIERAQRVGG